MLGCLQPGRTAQPGINVSRSESGVFVSYNQYTAAHYCRVSCRAHNRRLQQLIPDLAADAAVADVLPQPPVPADRLSSDSLDHSEPKEALFDAYLILTSTRGSNSRDEGASATADVLSVTHHAAWSVSNDADIDNAYASFNPAAQQQQQQQQQQGQGARQRKQQRLPQPVLTPLQDAFWAKQQQRNAQQESVGHTSAIDLAATDSSSAGSRLLQWRSASADTAGPEQADVPLGPAAAVPTSAMPGVVLVDDSDEAADTPAGGFFSSRAVMLQQLQQQQLQVQREHVLSRNKQQLYRYTVSKSDSSIKKQAMPAPVSPLKQTTFALAKQQQVPADQQRLLISADTPSSSSSSSTSSSSSRVDMQPTAADSAPSQLEPATPQQQHQQQQQQQQQDPSRGLTLSAFLYCCSRNEVLSLTWQLGLSPASLRFVSRVSDADLVLHVKPGKGERHYQYEEYRAQAAEKGIPFVDLKNLSLLELQLYLLPVFRLYAGELSPRDLLLRKKRRGPRRRYTSIKLPPVKQK